MTQIAEVQALRGPRPATVVRQRLLGARRLRHLSRPGQEAAGERPRAGGGECEGQP